MLEILVSQLQQENLQLRIDKAKKPKRRKKAIPKKRTFNAMDSSQPSPLSQPPSQPSQQENIPTDNSIINNNDGTAAASPSATSYRAQSAN
ncbi:hypothetical protein MUCCIDRAFT_113698 [Mucor lusitanicus CBS 277.49]|uniref:Uncharacterized protein n=1 Tax=Mucor lusitanicus CBS 277.49 TaxID=747725 RepID=A0A162YS15_MUCCL|nr:hypothetical protein MUCCIDRAFT_113698 [Mucor lusitanicus CBS 277.49]